MASSSIAEMNHWVFQSLLEDVQAWYFACLNPNLFGSALMVSETSPPGEPPRRRIGRCLANLPGLENLFTVFLGVFTNVAA